jgi:diguanylate cyclase (GGDEF)-like protein
METLQDAGDQGMVERDPLSGLLTQAAFEEHCQTCKNGLPHGHRDRALALLSVEQYDSIRDTFGEVVWNQTVDLMGHMIRSAIDPGDLAARYGDSGFIMLLAEGTRASAEAAVMRVRAAIEKANDAGALPTLLSVSVSLASGRDLSCADLITLAQRRMDVEKLREGVTTAARSSAILDPATGDVMEAITQAVILVVDDEPAILTFVRDALSEFCSEILSAAGADEALAHLRECKVDIVIMDIHLQGTSGLEMLKRVRLIDPTVVVIMITGSHDLHLAVRAIRCGADDYLLKPCQPQELRNSVCHGFMKRQLILGGKAYQALLETQVRQRTRELQQVIRHLESTYRATLKALGAALDTRDVETHSHSERAAQYALTLGRLLNMSESDQVTLERGVYLHDIGKIGLPDRVLLKQAGLTKEEWKIMRQHSLLGYRLASRVDFLKGASKIILAHHERYDGRGYPFGLKGEAIPLGARVFGVVDALDAMTSHRPYRKAKSFDHAREEIRKYSGSQFDPTVVEAFLSVPARTWSDMREAINDQAPDPALSQDRELIRDTLFLAASTNVSTEADDSAR